MLAFMKVESKAIVVNACSLPSKHGVKFSITYYLSRAKLCLYPQLRVVVYRCPLPAAFCRYPPPSYATAYRHRRCRLPPPPSATAAIYRRRRLPPPVAAVCHCLSLSFCSLASFLPILTFRILVGSIVANRSELTLKMATASSLSQGSIISFSGTPTITTEKLNWKNYKAWSDSVELWFLGQGFHDHLEKQEVEIPKENRAPRLKLDCQLCAILWQSVSPELLEILRSFKTCYSF
ncbi:hypothetical protein CR513_50824, partial [Mucuna pruriens]